MGTLHLPDKRNLAVVLLEGGLARRVGAAADRSTHAFELAAAEESAQGASLKVWENYAAEKAAAEAAAAAAAAAEEEAPLDDADKQVTELNLTEIVDGTGRVSDTAAAHSPRLLLLTHSAVLSHSRRPLLRARRRRRRRRPAAAPARHRVRRRVGRRDDGGGVQPDRRHGRRRKVLRRRRVVRRAQFWRTSAHFGAIL